MTNDIEQVEQRLRDAYAGSAGDPPNIADYVPQASARAAQITRRRRLAAAGGGLAAAVLLAGTVVVAGHVDGTHDTVPAADPLTDHVRLVASDVLPGGAHLRSDLPWAEYPSKDRRHEARLVPPHVAPQTGPVGYAAYGCRTRTAATPTGLVGTLSTSMSPRDGAAFGDDNGVVDPGWLYVQQYRPGTAAAGFRAMTDPNEPCSFVHDPKLPFQRISWEGRAAQTSYLAQSRTRDAGQDQTVTMAVLRRGDFVIAAYTTVTNMSEPPDAENPASSAIESRRRTITAITALERQLVRAQGTAP